MARRISEERVTLRLPVRLRQRIDQIAASRGMKSSAVWRELAASAIELNEK